MHNQIVVLDGKTLSIDGEVSFAGFDDLGEVIFYERTAPSQVAARIGDAPMVLLNKTPIDKEQMMQCPNLTYIGVMATGTNVVKDMDYATARGITVTNVPDYSTHAVAQMAFAHILSFYSQVDMHDAQVKQGRWQTCPDFSFYLPNLRELYQKTLGLVGFGNIGSQMARIAQSFGMNVLVYTRTPHPELEREGLRFVSLEEMLWKSDVVSIHAPLNDGTRGLFGSEIIAQMKKSAILINTARGPIVDEQAVAKALHEGKLLGFGTDVVAVEPILPDNPLLQAPRCHITPHIAWAGVETRQRLVEILLANIAAFLNGNPIHCVNR